jgi:uncharacterized protein YbjT (DUF2867 family)
LAKPSILDALSFFSRLVPLSPYLAKGFRMKLLVTGGNGFIGGHVCRAAVEAGHQVLAMGRSGRPKGSAPWMERVAWIAADVLEPASWRAHLAGCDAVVHCVGIAFEHPSRGVTFERVNGDAAVVAAGEAEAAGVGAFVFVSASEKPPLMREAYITAKRRAEAAIFASGPRGVALRPGFVYGPGRAVSCAVFAMMKAALLVPGVRRSLRGSRPVRVEVLARAALRVAADPSIAGIVDMEGIERLGSA